jgi:hypothetical protein
MKKKGCGSKQQSGAVGKTYRRLQATRNFEQRKLLKFAREI